MARIVEQWRCFGREMRILLSDYERRYMPRPADPRRDSAIAVISDMTRTHGVKQGLRSARKQFSDVPNATWARWRQAALGNVSKTEADAVVKLSTEVRDQIPSLQELAPAVDDPVPATHRALNFWKLLDELEQDAQLMREFALSKGANGKIKLRVAPALRDAHRMRCDLIRLALQQAEVAWSSERAAHFYQTIIDEIGSESPEVQKRILARLHNIQCEAAARGF